MSKKTKKIKPSDVFNEWFVLQYGPRPSKRAYSVIKEELDAARANLWVLENEMKTTEKWDDLNASCFNLFSASAYEGAFSVVAWRKRLGL